MPKPTGVARGSLMFKARHGDQDTRKEARDQLSQITNNDSSDAHKAAQQPAGALDQRPA